jgi:hypothetical protein
VDCFVATLLRNDDVRVMPLQFIRLWRMIAGGYPVQARRVYLEKLAYLFN